MAIDLETGEVTNGADEILEVPFVRSPYNYDRDEASRDSGLVCEDPSRTVQEARDEVDINTIVARFGLTGKFPEGLVMPVYGDFTGLSSYHDAANAIASANETFDALPANVRSRFQNDPGLFVDFALDPANRAEMAEWGMLAPSSSTLEGGSSGEPPPGSVDPKPA